MESEPALTRDTQWAWMIWCLAPAAALLLCLGRVPLWLTMPIDAERYATNWVLAIQVIVALALGPTLLCGRRVLPAIAVGEAFTAMSWIASDEPAWKGALLMGVQAAALGMVWLAACWGSASLFSVRVAICIGAVCWLIS